VRLDLLDIMLTAMRYAALDDWPAVVALFPLVENGLTPEQRAEVARLKRLEQMPFRRGVGVGMQRDVLRGVRYKRHLPTVQRSELGASDGERA